MKETMLKMCIAVLIRSGQVRHCVTAVSHASNIVIPLAVLDLELVVLIWELFLRAAACGGG